MLKSIGYFTIVVLSFMVFLPWLIIIFLPFILVVVYFCWALGFVVKSERVLNIKEEKEDISQSSEFEIQLLTLSDESYRSLDLNESDKKKIAYHKNSSKNRKKTSRRKKHRDLHIQEKKKQNPNEQNLNN